MCSLLSGPKNLLHLFSLKNSIDNLLSQCYYQTKREGRLYCSYTQKGVHMNERNRKLFFDEDNEEAVVITLTDEDGIETDAEIIAAVEIEELGKEYIAVMPITPTDAFEDGEALIMVYSEDEDGDPAFDMLESEEEIEIVTEAFQNLLEEAAEEDDDEIEITDDYLDEIENMIPGISIKKDK